MSVGIEIQPEGLWTLRRRFDRIAAGLHDLQPLMRKLAFVGENQTRRRIEDERKSPSGEPWQRWSTAYAKTRHPGQRLLQSSGALLDSLTAFADDQVAGWGSKLEYAAFDQFGSDSIPARPYLGLSEDNIEELLDIADAYVERLLDES